MKYKFPQLSQAMCKTTFYTMGPGAAKKHLHLISKWIENVGTRQTAKRLKSVMVAINLRLDNQVDKSDMYLFENTHLTWRSKSLSTFRFLYNSLKTCKSNYKASRLYTVLKLYTGLDYTMEVKLEDRIKLLDTVMNPIKDLKQVADTINSILNTRGSANQLDFDSQLLVDILVKATRYVKTNLIALRPSRVRYVNNKTNSVISSRTDLYHNINYKLICDLINYKPPYWVTVEDFRDSSKIDINTIIDHSLSLGHASKKLEQYDASLSIIPKPGSDGRVIAKLPVILQLLMSQFHNIMEDFRSKYSNIFYWKRQHDMADRARYCESRCSTDLSAATDRIPRHLFIYYLKRLLAREEVIKLAKDKFNGLVNTGQLSIADKNWDTMIAIAKDFIDRHNNWLERISTMRWKSPYHGIPITYTVGQPMGMLGSFPILDISNYLLASYCDPTDSKFAIVGDDIIWEDKNLMEKYISVSTRLGIEISNSKTYQNGLAQAVGREITSRFTALPLKFSKHRKTNDLKYQMWYCALYPKLVKKYKLPNGKSIPITKELITKEVQRWHNQTFEKPIMNQLNQLNWDKDLFKANLESAIDLYISNTKEVRDLRSHNHGKINIDNSKDNAEILKQMLVKSEYTLSKLAAVSMKTNPILSEKDYIDNTKIANAEISKSVPHAVNDLYPIHRKGNKTKQAKGDPVIDENIEEIKINISPSKEDDEIDNGNLHKGIPRKDSQSNELTPSTDDKDQDLSNDFDDWGLSR